MIALKWQDYGQPQYCINRQYVMKYAWQSTPRWIIRDASSLGEKEPCS
jgi:hypothetical protein